MLTHTRTAEGGTAVRREGTRKGGAAEAEERRGNSRADRLGAVDAPDDVVDAEAPLAHPARSQPRDDHLAGDGTLALRSTGEGTGGRESATKGEKEREGARGSEKGREGARRC